LTHPGTFAEPLTEYLTLTNTTPEPLAFKVKTTAPKLYCVRPNANIVAPGESMKISVILQGYTTPLPKDFKCKDKFLIVSCPCPGFEDASKVAENWAALYQEHGQQGVQKKLRVNFIIEEDVRDD
ncbi:PapD-like protein, partial [Metschnikowia bicuspidata var. bicuspidata NRRL YB-4993]